MTDIRAEDVQRLTDLANTLADIRRDLRRTAKEPRSQTPELLAQNITALADYIAAASRLRVQMSHRTGPAPANVGEDWGPTYAATRSGPVLHKLTELLDDSCRLANQLRPRSTTRSHFHSPGLDLRVSDRFVDADKDLTQIIGTIRRFRTGLGQVRKRELVQEQEALANPNGRTAQMVAARATARGHALVLVPQGFEQEAASASAAAKRAGAPRPISRTAAATAQPAPASLHR